MFFFCSLCLVVCAHLISFLYVSLTHVMWRALRYIPRDNFLPTIFYFNPQHETFMSLSCSSLTTIEGVREREEEKKEVIVLAHGHQHFQFVEILFVEKWASLWNCLKRLVRFGSRYKLSIMMVVLNSLSSSSNKKEEREREKKKRFFDTNVEVSEVGI
jgi:hypothetical protein